MRFSKGVTIWAVFATVLLAISLAWPDAPRRGLDALSQAGRARVAQAQTADSPAQLEWLGWMFFRLTSPRGKVILFSPWLNEPGPFSNRDSTVRLENIEVAHVILVPAGHADDMGHAVPIARRTGAPVVTTFELASWLVSQGVEAGKILRGGAGSRFEVEGIKIQVVNSVHGSGAAAPGQPASIYGGQALGFVVTLENGVKVYHAMSTAITQDLQLYGRLYKPHVALLAIGCCMYPEEAALATEFLMTDNPNLHSVFPTHHSSWAHPPAQQGAAFVREVQARRLRREVTAFDPKPGQTFLITSNGTRAR